MKQKNALLRAVHAYLSADLQDRVKALESLIIAYGEARDAPEPETLSAAPAVARQYEALAREADFDSAESLFEAVLEHPPLTKYIREYLAAPAVEAASGLPEIIIRPAEPVTQSIARIGVSAARVSVILPEKDESFREVVKGMGYEWDRDRSVWAKAAPASGGWQKAQNMAAELGHTLLAAGFWIAPPLPEIREMIVGEEFEVEHRRKVMDRKGGKYDGWLVLWWSRSEDCYDAARKISGSRYDKPVVVVPPEFYDEVEDFAGMHGFHITPRARGLIGRARAAVTSALLLEIDEAEEGESDDGTKGDDGIPVLDVPDKIGIDDDLADND